MKPLTKQMRKSALAAFFITSLFLFLMLQQSCKKTESILPNADEQITVNGKQVNITDKFFTLPANTGSAVQRVAAELRRQNNNKEFITSFAKKEGFAVWGKAIISVSKPKANTGHLGESNVENNGDTTVIIPLVQSDSIYVVGF